MLLLLNLLTARFEAEFVDSFLVPLLLSSLQGSVCGESSCFRISNVVDNLGKGGAEILYVAL